MPAPTRNEASAPIAYEPVAGSAPGWLRVLPAEQLLQNVQSDKALQEIWRQSRQSALVWERDFMPAIRRYAEFVQLVPASEAHHHAHVGGLLSHTVEMVLAAVTWRNGYLLPSGEPIEVIDAQRDVWTYVVFYAALLHDIAKPITDLRITWRARGMADPLRWVAQSGSLLQITQGRAAPEYKVDFAPKSQRDYTAHARLAALLLPGIAPPSAMAFLALQPNALEALNQYLCGVDRDSLVAQVVRRADKASTQRALLTGSKARFSTATSVPLIDLLMQALGAMLRAGTSLPLNRSGAAGWVFEGSIWFVAKRVADGVREWIRTHAPDEAVPGDTKNDRLFDTWQEYGAIDVNPQTQQAVWYVTVHGAAGDSDVDERAGEADDAQPGAGAYKHSLTMLRFPLVKLYEAAAQYPQAMHGRIEVHLKRNPDAVNTDEAAADVAPEAGSTRSSVAAEAAARPGSNGSGSAADVNSVQRNDASAAAQGKKQEAWPSKPALKEPSFNKPKPAKNRSADGSAAMSSERSRPGAADGQGAAPPPKQAKPEAIVVNDAIEDYEAAFLLDEMESAAWLGNDDDVSAMRPDRSRKAARQEDLRAARTPPVPAATAPVPRAPRAVVAVPAGPGQLAVLPYLAQSSSTPKLILDRAPEISARSAERPPSAAMALAPSLPAPVVLAPKLPDLPQRDAKAGAPPASERALAFVGWLQASLASRELKYNETGAAIHFTLEGMALVSPLIFKLYARTLMSEAAADEHAMEIQREVIKAGWHMMGPNRKNIVQYEVHGRTGKSVSKLSAVVLVDPSRFVVPVPPSNPVLKLV